MQNPEEKLNILVLGTGNFGTCLCQLFASKGYNVTAWTRDSAIAESINTKHRNPKYLSEHMLDVAITAVTEIDILDISLYAAVIIAIPTQAIREVLTRFKEKLVCSKVLICTAKGIEISTLSFPIAIIGSILGKEYKEDTVILSGPSFASEIITNQPTGVSLASLNPAKCLVAQEICHHPYFRAYTSHDPIGLEVAGALKNIIAIASGAASGLGYQQNTRASFMTRGLAEITRFGIAMGANPLTFNGLGGVGDLFLTCSSQKSRNFTVGYKLAQGEPLDQILTDMGSVAEGVPTSLAAYQMSKTLAVDSPIIDQVYSVLYLGTDVRQAMQHLINRPPKPEITFP